MIKDMKASSHLTVIALAAAVLFSPSVWVTQAVSAPLPPDAESRSFQLQQQQLIREQQRQQQLQQHMQPDVDGRLDDSAVQIPATLALPRNEAPCFTVQRIELVGDSAARFRFALNQAMAQSGYRSGLCLGWASTTS